MDKVLLEKLERINVNIEDNKIIYIDQIYLVYQVLEILKPLPLQFVQKEQADLTQIFLKLVR